MAASSDFSSSSWIVNQELFKAYLRAGLADKRKIRCFIREDCAEKVYKGFNQFFHWEKKLQVPEHRSVLTFTYMGPTGLIKPNIDVVQDVISSKLGKGLIDCINYPENSNFLTLVMSTPEAAQAARQVVSNWSGAQACFIESKAHNVYVVQILWTPVYYKIEGVQETLRPWCEEVKIEYENIVFSNGEQIKTNKVTGLITLKEGISLSQVPHVVKLVDSDNKYVLIVIRDRPPLCLKCRMEGHIRKSCVVKKCLRCNQLHDLRESCPKKTFASVTRGEKISWLVDKNLRMKEIEETESVHGQERKDPNYFNTVMSKIDKNQDSQSVSMEGKNISDGGQTTETGSLAAENASSSGQENTCTLTENDGFELVTRRGVQRKVADGKELGYIQKFWASNDIISEKEGIYAALEDEMDWGQEMDIEDAVSEVTNKDISHLAALKVAESSSQSAILREDDIQVKTNFSRDAKTGSKKKTREQKVGGSLEKKIKLSDNTLEMVESPNASFIINVKPEEECETPKEYREIEDLESEVLGNSLVESMKDSDMPLMGVMTRAASKALGKSTEENIMSLVLEATDTKNTEVDTSKITSEGIEDSDRDKSENDENSDSDLELCLQGFEIDATVDTVWNFMKGHKPAEVWANFKTDQPDGVFGAKFGTKEEAEAALTLHRKRLNGKRICVSHFGKL